MVSPFTLGLFAPLPLAMMIPFMATQSLAMGEAFGKSFQYGKRKISSMTNDEFNKLTFNDLMDQQTANIKSIIPKLHEQMEDSYAMQKDIFTEMTKLLPAALEALGAEFRKIGGDFDTSQSAPSPFGSIPNPSTIQPASHTTEQANVQEVTIINASHDGKSTIGTPEKTYTKETSSNPTSSVKNNFRSKISGWNLNTIREYQHSGLMTPWQSKIIDERQVTINLNKDTPKYENLPKPPPQKPLSNQQIQQKKYLDTVTTYQSEILRWKRQRESYNWETKNNVRSWNWKQQNTQYEKNIKLLKNYITQSRNNINLKSVANSDWNARIWTKL